MDPIRPTLVVTLVHGTFARGATWTKVGSNFRKIIFREQNGDVQFRSFEWSGHNNHKQRLAAGDDLRRFLGRVIDEFPASKHFVVGHSHGGNVIVYSLRDGRLADRITGVITLGTPFISCAPRNVSRTITILSFTTPPLLLLLLTMIIIPVWINLSFLIPNNAARIIIGVGGGLAIVLTMFFVVAGRLFKFLQLRSHGWATVRQQAIMAALNIPVLDRPKFLCAIVPGDEAGLLLTAMHKTSNIPYDAFQMLTNFIKNNAWILIIAIIATAFFAGPLNMNWANSLGLTLVKVGIGSLYLALALQIPMLFLPRVVRAHRFGFGGEKLIDNWLTDIVVAASPNNVPSETTALREHHGSGLSHSSFYEDEKLAVDICKWMNRQV